MHLSPEGHPFGDVPSGAHATTSVVHVAGGTMTDASGWHVPPDAVEPETVNVVPEPQPLTVVWTLGHPLSGMDAEPQLDAQPPLPNWAVTAPHVAPDAGPHEQAHVALGAVASEVPPSKRE
jgi:hypothetical protein